MEVKTPAIHLPGWHSSLLMNPFRLQDYTCMVWQVWSQHGLSYMQGLSAHLLGHLSAWWWYSQCTEWWQSYTRWIIRLKISSMRRWYALPIAQHLADSTVHEFSWCHTMNLMKVDEYDGTWKPSTVMKLWWYDVTPEYELSHLANDHSRQNEAKHWQIGQQ